MNTMFVLRVVNPSSAMWDGRSVVLAIFWTESDAWDGLRKFAKWSEQYAAEFAKFNNSAMSKWLSERMHAANQLLQWCRENPPPFYGNRVFMDDADQCNVVYAKLPIDLVFSPVPVFPLSPA